MDFLRDHEQEALADAVRSLLKGYDAERRRAVTETDPGFDEEIWQGLAEMGVLGLPFPEDVGGSGGGPVDVAVVAEEIGAVIAPEPFVEAVVLTGGLIAACGSPEQQAELLGSLASGEMVPAFAWLTTPGHELHVNEGRVTGVAEPVLNGGRADVFVVLADDTLLLVDAADTERTSYRTLDGGRAGRVTFDQAAARPLGAGGDATDTVEQVLAATRIASCHESLGAMEAALRLTTGYLTTRKQFGVTLNHFQALTFRAADMYTSLELTRSIVTWATMVLADPRSTPVQVRDAAARAKLQVSRAGRHIGQEAIQLHGGIGMTMEYAVGHLVARLTTLDHLLGDGDAQVAALAPRLGDYEVVEPLP